MIRSTGLYTLNRGAHSYWFTNPPLGSPSSYINLIHYRDAASLVQTVLHNLNNGVDRGNGVVLCNDNRVGGPLTRQEIVDAAYCSDNFNPGRIKAKPVFVEGSSSKRGRDDGVKGKVVEGEEGEGLIAGWDKKWGGFDDFMSSDCIDELD